MANWFKKLFVTAKAEANAAHPAFDNAADRKAWVENYLTERGVPINSHLPLTESVDEIKLRTPKEVADRVLGLVAVAIKGEGVDPEIVANFISERSVRKLLTPKELAFIETTSPDPHQRAQFSWQYECVWVLLWSLRHVEGSLAYPGQICDVPKLAGIVRDTNQLDGFGLVPPATILTELDLHYRYHWAVRQAGIDGQPNPGGLDGGVVMERHRALNWLVRYMDADWDDVGTDT